MSAVEKFPILLSEAEEESSAVPPCFSDEGINVGRDSSGAVLEADHGSTFTSGIPISISSLLQNETQTQLRSCSSCTRS